MVYLNSKWKGVRTDMAVENIGMRAMNKKTLDYVSNQRERTQEAYYLIDDLNKAMGTDEQTTIDKETLQTLLVYFADAFSNESDYLEWCSEVEVEYASEADRESMLTEEVEYLKKENKQYVERLRDMVEDRNNATKEYISLTRENANLLKLKEELEEKNMPQEVGSFTRFPDIIMMDGGRGQVNICLQVLEELGLDIPVCGMVKDDNHRTRGLYYNNVEIPIDRHSEGFKLVTRIQDEAHRFAIEYHRSLRSKAQVHSVLDDIEGIGPARRKALMRRFKSLEAVRDATLEELESTEGMNKRAAESVYAYFREKDRAPEITE